MTLFAFTCVALVCILIEAFVILHLLQERRAHDAAQKELLNRLMYMANKPWEMPGETSSASDVPPDIDTTIHWPDAVVN